MCIHEIKGNLYNYQHIREGSTVHSIYMGPVSGKRPWIKSEIGDIKKGQGSGVKKVHEPPLKVDKVTLQNIKEVDVKERKRMVEDISKVKAVKIPDNSVESYFNGAGEIVDQTYTDDQGRTWKLPTVAPQKAREEIYTKVSMKHPAKMNPVWAQAMIQKYSEPGDTILDPMGGIGTTGVEASRLGRNAVIIDYEKKWINQARKNVELLERSGQKIGDVRILQGDARNIQVNKKIDIIMFSPPYGHAGLGGNWAKASRQEREKIIKKGEKARRDLQQEYHAYSTNNDNIGLKAGNEYFNDMSKVYSRCDKVLKPNGIMVVNTKNRVEQGKEVRFDLETQRFIEKHGFKFIEKKRVHAPPSQFRTIYEQKYPDAPKIHHEDFMIFQKN